MWPGGDVPRVAVFWVQREVGDFEEEGVAGGRVGGEEGDCVFAETTHGFGSRAATKPEMVAGGMGVGNADGEGAGGFGDDVGGADSGHGDDAALCVEHAADLICKDGEDRIGGGDEGGGKGFVRDWNFIHISIQRFDGWT